MAEPAKSANAPDTFIVPDPDNVPVTFVNQVFAAGALNGVVNLNLAVALFSPNVAGKIEADAKVACRLRMDMGCAQQMHTQLGRILAEAAAAAPGIASAVLATTAMPGPSGKSN